MKRLSIAIILCGSLILAAHAAARSLPAAAPPMAEVTVTPLIPGPFPTPRIPPDKTYYRRRCWPACHYDTERISEEPPRLTSDFDGTLGSGWRWINEDPDHWTLTEGSSTLRIVPKRASVLAADGLQGANNVLVHDAPAGYFDIVTRVRFEPRFSFQEAGVVIELDKGSAVFLSRGYCEEEDSPSCVGSGVYFDARGVGCGRSGIQTSSETVNLMLRRAGSSYVGYYSLGENVEPEAEWIEVGRCYQPRLSPTRVGLAVAGGPETQVSEVAADFDFFTIIERK